MEYDNQDTYNSPTPTEPVRAEPKPAPVSVHSEEISHKRANADIDAELEKLLAAQKTRIKVIGCGGGGNNTINRISEVDRKSVV